LHARFASITELFSVTINYTDDFSHNTPNIIWLKSALKPQKRWQMAVTLNLFLAFLSRAAFIFYLISDNYILFIGDFFFISVFKFLVN
jgi:hypothetical protein